MNKVILKAEAAKEAASSFYFRAVTFVMVMLAGAPALAATRRPRTSKALSFLEYAILAAAIVLVGVLIANFFGSSLRTLLSSITASFAART